MGFAQCSVNSTGGPGPISQSEEQAAPRYAPTQRQGCRLVVKGTSPT